LRSSSLRSSALALIVLAAAAWSQDAPIAPPELIEVVGGADAWGGLAPWRQRMIAERYQRYQRAPERKQAKIREVGLRDWLLMARERPGFRELPDELRRELKALPEDVRRLAGKTCFMRLRHLRRDRNLAMVPFPRRRELFRRLYPEPFDHEAARRAHRELNRYVSRAMAARMRKRWEAESQKVTEAQRQTRLRELVREYTQKEEEAIVRKVRKELLRFRSHKPDGIRRKLKRDGLFILDQIELFATPRQSELIRYALRPEQCPLLDPGLMGERPEDPAARKEWQRDFRTLARIDLLTEAGFPPQMVLHLAASNSPEDLLRGLRALRGHRQRNGNPNRLR